MLEEQKRATFATAEPMESCASKDALPQIAETALAARLAALERGKSLTLIGIDRAGVAATLKSSPADSRGALLLDHASFATAEALLGHLLEDLATLALAQWPFWYGCDMSSCADLPGQARAGAGISIPWLDAARRLVAAGRPPRLHKAGKAHEFTQLMGVFYPAEPLLVATLDPASPQRATPLVQVLEWCLARGAAVVATLSSRPPPVAPYDRLLYGAFEVMRVPEPALLRFIGARAHHASLIEQRMEEALRRDTELAFLFSCNEIVELDTLGTPPRVDLLWRDGRVVIELDGPEHQADPKFAQDRHRDYELLVAGYLVLRMTNAEIERDLQRAVEKIRAVVRFRRSRGA